eukprot:m51a1_g12719 hypothetical protein (328) ;mRNA; r:46-1546
MNNTKKLALVFLVLALGVLVPLVAIAASSQPSTTVARGARSAPLLSADSDTDGHTRADASASGSSRFSRVFQDLGSLVLLCRHARTHPTLSPINGAGVGASASAASSAIACGSFAAGVVAGVALCAVLVGRHRRASRGAVNEACDVATLEVVVGDVDAAAMVHADSSSSSGGPLSAALIPAGSADSTKAHQDDADRADRDASLAARQSDVGPADDDAHAGRADKTSSGTSARASADATTDRPVDSASCATGPAGHTPVSDCAAEAEGDKRSDCHESSDSAAAADGAEDAADGQSGTGHENHEDHEDHEGPQDPESSSGEDARRGRRS